MLDSIGSFLLAVLLSTAAGHALTQLWTDRRDSLKLKREAAGSALLAAIALEVFADQCMNIYRGRLRLDRDERENVNFQSLPSEPEFNDKIDWTVIDSSLADDALTFGHLVRKRASGVKPAKAWHDVKTDTAEMSEELKEKALELCRTAIDLASDLRAKHGLRSRDMQGSWEVPAMLESYEAEEMRKGKKAREERDREHAAIAARQR